MKENLHFKKSPLNYINNAPSSAQKQEEKEEEHIILVIRSISLGVAAKTDDEIYVLNTIIQLLFICFFYCTKEGRFAENLESDVATLKIVTVIKKW